LGIDDPDFTVDVVFHSTGEWGKTKSEVLRPAGIHSRALASELLGFTEISLRDPAFTLCRHLPAISSSSYWPFKWRHSDQASGAPGLAFRRASSKRKERRHVELSAIAVVPAREEFAATCAVRSEVQAASENPLALYSSRMPILGNDLLESWADRIRRLGLRSLWLTSGGRDGNIDGSTLAELVRHGVERLLVIRLKSYAEMDLADLLRFHSEKQNPVTEAQDARGQLGVCLLDRPFLQTSRKKLASSCAPTDDARIPYQFNGYAKRILAARERQELVGDALTGACALRPLGTQIREQVWVGEGVQLAGSARVIGPAYIGARTAIGAGATIGPFVSVEHDCVVDCGTRVEHSAVLPNTYLAPGLFIRNSQVDGRHLEHLGWEAVADLQPAGLGRRIQARQSRPQAFSAAEKEALSRAGNSFSLGWDLAASSTLRQRWLRVQL
jgi:carbonic anhydrase/acetyltransferase-like protein (isoleucine patch superfamily)